MSRQTGGPLQVSGPEAVYLPIPIEIPKGMCSVMHGGHVSNVQELACSVRRANPLYELVVLSALDDLTVEQQGQVRGMADLLQVQDPLLGTDPRWVPQP